MFTNDQIKSMGLKNMGSHNGCAEVPKASQKSGLFISRRTKQNNNTKGKPNGHCMHVIVHVNLLTPSHTNNEEKTC